MYVRAHGNVYTLGNVYTHGNVYTLGNLIKTHLILEVFVQIGESTLCMLLSQSVSVYFQTAYG